MDDLNKLETVPTLDALVKEQTIVEVKPVEPAVEESPAPVAAQAPKLTPTIVIPQPAPAAQAPTPKPAKEDDGLVALYSGKNFVTILKGYSKVDKTLAEELLKNKNIRLATEEEAKQHLNK